MGWTGGTAPCTAKTSVISHMSLRIEGWDGHRVMLKDGTSLNVWTDKWDGWVGQ